MTDKDYIDEACLRLRAAYEAHQENPSDPDVHMAWNFTSDTIREIVVKLRRLQA